jgi:hypothetical protein
MSKQPKKLTRKRRLAEEKRRRHDLECKHEFPRFVFEPNEASEEFVEAVRQATRTIDFLDQTVFGEEDRRFYRRFKEAGFSRAMKEKRSRAEGVGIIALILDTHVALKLAGVLFQRIPSQTLLQFIPFHDFRILPEANHIRFFFRSLRQAKGAGGTIYYSRHDPKLVVDGQERTVAFSRHAIEQACARLCSNWPSYADLGDVFAFFDQCLEFEACKLLSGEPGFTFFYQCAPHTWELHIAEAILSDKFDPNQQYCFRVGYCPVVVDGAFFKAKTLLFPGFKQTPEYGTIVSARLPRERRESMKREAEQLDAIHLRSPGGVELLKWFHDQGVPQIRAGVVRYANATSP